MRLTSSITFACMYVCVFSVCVDRDAINIQKPKEINSCDTEKSACMIYLYLQLVNKQFTQAMVTLQ